MAFAQTQRANLDKKRQICRPIKSISESESIKTTSNEQFNWEFEMNKVTFIAISILFAAQTAFATSIENEYAEGDGTLDFICTDINTEAKPHNTFNFTLKYKKNSDRQGFDIISDDNLASMNGDIVYQIDVVQVPFMGAEIVTLTQPISGCQTAPVAIRKTSDTTMELYYECDADGDAGFGTLNLDLKDFSVTGEVNFPEGKSSLLYPIVEDSSFSVTCQPQL